LISRATRSANRAPRGNVDPLLAGQLSADYIQSRADN
jgi:hypothetical protein